MQIYRHQKIAKMTTTQPDTQTLKLVYTFLLVAAETHPRAHLSLLIQDALTIYGVTVNSTRIISTRQQRQQVGNYLQGQHSSF